MINNLYLVVDTFETSSFVIPSIYVLAFNFCQAVAHIDETARGGGGPSPPPGGPSSRCGPDFAPKRVVLKFNQQPAKRRILMNFLRLVRTQDPLDHIVYKL